MGSGLLRKLERFVAFPNKYKSNSTLWTHSQDACIGFMQFAMLPVLPWSNLRIIHLFRTAHHLKPHMKKHLCLIVRPLKMIRKYEWLWYN